MAKINVYPTRKCKYGNNANHPMLSLNLQTGKGKTYCSITALSYLGFRSIIITNSNEWLSQWKAFFLEYTDISSDEIHYISGIPTLPLYTSNKNIQFPFKIPFISSWLNSFLLKLKFNLSILSFSFIKSWFVLSAIW